MGAIVGPLLTGVMVDLSGFAGTLEICALFTATCGLVLLPLSGYGSLPKGPAAVATASVASSVDEAPKPTLTKKGFVSLNQEAGPDEEIDYSTGETSS